MKGLDWVLKNFSIGRRDDEKTLSKDIKESIKVGLNIDNIKEDIDKRMEKVDRKLEHVEELEEDARDTLEEVEEKLEEIDMRISIIEFKLAGAVVLGLVYLSIISAQEGNMYVSYSAAILATITSLETLLTLYRSFFGDFIVKSIKKIK